MYSNANTASILQPFCIINFCMSSISSHPWWRWYDTRSQKTRVNRRARRGIERTRTVLIGQIYFPSHLTCPLTASTPQNPFLASTSRTELYGIFEKVSISVMRWGVWYGISAGSDNTNRDKRAWVAEEWVKSLLRTIWITSTTYCVYSNSSALQ